MALRKDGKPAHMLTDSAPPPTQQAGTQDAAREPAPTKKTGAEGAARAQEPPKRSAWHLPSHGPVWSSHTAPVRRLCLKKNRTIKTATAQKMLKTTMTVYH
ncbi:hypothetical protein PF001_g28522 [Phytophthora fragariae]|uniref:Uncharacterized protein n=1 Tax=Phytophthora fragariae TaxID=53985 RepID=A0A6A4BHU4_9STRA|nr:hypothetical protein PF006_g28428 [Phytophthora fragariae]KAE9271119.1 hypothetical protein PF001_g28522 [Phytophthora fragariae]